MRQPYFSKRPCRGQQARLLLHWPEDRLGKDGVWARKHGKKTQQAKTTHRPRPCCLPAHVLSNNVSIRAQHLVPKPHSPPRQTAAHRHGCCRGSSARTAVCPGRGETPMSEAKSMNRESFIPGLSFLWPLIWSLRQYFCTTVTAQYHSHSVYVRWRGPTCLLLL